MSKRSRVSSVSFFGGFVFSQLQHSIQICTSYPTLLNSTLSIHISRIFIQEPTFNLLYWYTKSLANSMSNIVTLPGTLDTYDIVQMNIGKPCDTYMYYHGHQLFPFPSEPDYCQTAYCALLTLSLSQCALARPVYTGMPLEYHWLIQCTLGYHWTTQQILAWYTETPLEKLAPHWRNPCYCSLLWNTTEERDCNSLHSPRHI